MSEEPDEIEVCATCGEKHQREGRVGGAFVRTCVAHSSDGTFCRNFPIKGGTVCYNVHGGRYPQVQAKARERLERARAEKAVATYGLPREIDPFTAIAEEIARTAGIVDWLQEIISAMEPIDLIWGETATEKSETVGLGTGAKGDDTNSTTESVRSEASLSVWLKLYKEERTHLVSVCATAIKLGFKQREVELLETQGRMLIAVFRAVFDDPEAGLDEPKKQVMFRLASQHIRRLRALPPPDESVA